MGGGACALVTVYVCGDQEEAVRCPGLLPRPPHTLFPCVRILLQSACLCVIAYLPWGCLGLSLALGWQSAAQLFCLQPHSVGLQALEGATSGFSMGAGSLN